MLQLCIIHLAFGRSSFADKVEELIMEEISITKGVKVLFQEDAVLVALDLAFQEK
jgi:hypothetical protein